MHQVNTSHGQPWTAADSVIGARYFTPGLSVHARRLVLLQRSVADLSSLAMRQAWADRMLFNEEFELRTTAGWLIAQGCESRFSAARSPGCFCQAGVVAPPDSLMCETTAISAGAR